MTLGLSSSAAPAAHKKHPNDSGVLSYACKQSKERTISLVVVRGRGQGKNDKNLSQKIETTKRTAKNCFFGGAHIQGHFFPWVQKGGG